MMTKKAQVVALPYKEQEIVSPQEAGRYIDVLTRHESPVTGFTWDYRRYMDGMIAQNPYHLYFTTDEEIKEGDWYINLRTLITFKADDKFNKRNNPNQNKENKKVVATTNPDLWKQDSHFSRKEKCIAYHQERLPKIPTDFIEAYVREQGSIKEVLLEYEQKPKKITECEHCGGSGIYDEGNSFISKCRCCYSELTLTERENAKDKNQELKLRPNGTVIIHPIKERTWTDEQVIEMISGFASYFDDRDEDYYMPQVRDWFTKNYPE